MTSVSIGARMIAEGRKRQVEAEGYTTAHDDEHAAGELARAARCYLDAADTAATVEALRHYGRTGDADALLAEMREASAEWPWEPEAWKPSTDRLANLVRAGALVAAEIDRLHRKGYVEGRTTTETR